VTSFKRDQEECKKLAEAIDRLIELDEQASVKQLERAAWQSLTDAIIDALPDGLVVTDAAGKVVLVNQKAEIMFGYHRSEIVGESVEKLVPERARARHAHDREMYNRFDLSLRGRTMGGVAANLVGIRSDGHEFLAEITLSRMVVPRGVLNLALIRFARQAIEVAMERDRESGPEPGKEHVQDSDRFDARIG
jgi:PAS domain S-box-containing protein